MTRESREMRLARNVLSGVFTMASGSPSRPTSLNLSSSALMRHAGSCWRGLLPCRLALLAAIVLPFGSVAQAQLAHFAPAALSVVPRLISATSAPSIDSTPAVIADRSLRIAYHDSLHEAAERVDQAFDRVFVSVSTSDIVSGEAALLGASRNELGVAREQIRPLSELEAGMLAAGALGVAVQLAVYLEPSGDAHRASGPRRFAELVIVPGGMLARAWF